jgi:hypothetical protein
VFFIVLKFFFRTLTLEAHISRLEKKLTQGFVSPCHIYQTVFPTSGSPYHSSRCEMDSSRCFTMALSAMFRVIPMNLEL